MIYDEFNPLIANMIENPLYSWIEILYRDLDVDAILGGQSRNRG